MLREQAVNCARRSMLDQQADAALHQPQSEDGQFYLQHTTDGHNWRKVNWTVRCPHGHPGRPVIACRHCERQDELHPAGMTVTQHGLLLCPLCLRQYDRNRLHQDSHDLCIFCWHCVLAEINRVRGIDPTKFYDRRPPDKRLYFEDELMPHRIIIAGPGSIPPAPGSQS